MPICVNWNQNWYVADVSTVDNKDGTEITQIKIYKNGATWAIVSAPPIWTITEWLCVIPAPVIENSNKNRITGVQALWAIINVDPTFTWARDVTVYNQYNTTVSFEYRTTANATFHRVNIPRGWTFSNTLKKDNYIDEWTYTEWRIIFEYLAGVAGTVANPNEINVNRTT